MTRRRFPVDGIVNIRTNVGPTKKLTKIKRLKGDEVRDQAWHEFWHDVVTMPSWKMPHWSEYAVDVGGWQTGREFCNWYTYNVMCCYLWLERMTRGMYPVDDIQSLLSSPRTGQAEQVFDGVTNPYIMRSKNRLGSIVERYFRPVSDIHKTTERVVYPNWGLLAMLDLIDERFEEQCDIWKRNMRYRRQRSEINRAEFLTTLTKRYHLRTTARSLDRLGPSLED